MESLDALTDRLNTLIRDHHRMHLEIRELRDEVARLRTQPGTAVGPPPDPQPEPPQTESPQTETPVMRPGPPPLETTPAQPPRWRQWVGDSWEDFIGGNLIAKLGIIILVLGIGFLVKYAADRDLMGPTVRVGLGYLAGLVLLGLAYRWQSRYRLYSALLLSGGLAILYFSTFAAYAFYALIPQGAAFGLMVLLTVFGVLAAYRYKVEAIAVIGLVGAYGVPPLLSDGTGEIQTMFAYMLIINVGVLGLALRRYWRVTTWAAFALTWLIYGGWFVDRYAPETQLGIALGFGAGFFLVFYAAFLAYKLWHREAFAPRDVVAILANAFLFYGFGYVALDQAAAVTGQQARYLGLFTVSQALVHFGVTLLVYYRRRADRNLFHLVAGLVLAYLALAIPVQLEGEWVTLLWAAGALALFWTGQRQGAGFYARMGYALAVMAVISLTEDWAGAYAGSTYDPDVALPPLLNLTWLSTCLVAGILGVMCYLDRRHARPEPVGRFVGWLDRNGRRLLPLLLLVVLVAGPWQEISHACYRQVELGTVEVEGAPLQPYYWLEYRSLALTAWVLLFVAGLGLVNARFWQDRRLGIITLLGVLAGTLMLFGEAVPALGDLRAAYLGEDEAIFRPGLGQLGWRYLLLALGVAAWYATARQGRWLSPSVMGQRLFELLGHVALLAWLSTELYHWLVWAAGAEGTFEAVQRARKAGFSILWAVYALGLLGLGFRTAAAWRRIAAFALLGIVLVKVFLFDLAETSIAYKTVLFLALGVLLLVASFLYQRLRPQPEPGDEALPPADPGAG